MTPIVLFVSLLTAPADRFEFWPGAKYDTPSFEKVFSHAPGERILSHAEILAYVDALEATSSISGSRRSVSSAPSSTSRAATLWEENRKQLAFKPLTMVQGRGLGLVIAFTFDPNFRAYMEGLNVMFLNAVFRGPARARPPVL